MISEVLDINCSEVMIKNFQDILSTWNTSNQECQEVVSPFQIKNETGYSLVVEYSYTKDPDVINSGCTIDHIVDYYSRDKILRKSDTIKVSLYPGDFQPPTMKIKTNKVQSSSYSSNELIIVVDVELLATRKTLTVRSPVIIENQTKFNATFLFTKTGKVENRTCSPGKSCPVPYDFIKGALSIEINDSRSQKLINLDDL